MTLTEECVIKSYNQIATLNEEHNVFLVQHKYTKSIYVMKKLTVYNASVFEALQKNHVKGTPEIHEVIEDSDVLTIIEEYISGHTLRDILDDGNRFSADETIDIISKLCEILRRLHNFIPVIVHRDVKPSNIIITADNEVKLLDMNAAKFISENAAQDTSLLGTVGYAAPEQYGFGVSGVQADIYSTGKIMAEMLPDNADGKNETMCRLEQIIQKCTKMDPSDRYASIDELMNDLNPNSAPNARKNSAYAKYMIPGFRSMKPQNMVIAAIGYFILFSVALSMKIQSDKASFLWLERSFFIIIALSVIFMTCNYMNVWHILKIDRIKHPIIKFFAVIISDVLLAFILLIIMVLIEA